MADKPKINGIDLDQIRAPQDFSALAGTRKEQGSIPVRRASNETWFRAHPDEANSLSLALFERDRDRFIVLPHLVPPIANLVKNRCVILCIDRPGNLFLWPIGNPRPDGRLDTWNESAWRALPFARRQWIRLESNHRLSAYDRHLPPRPLPDPEWPDDLEFAAIIEQAFAGRIIDNEDHEILRELRGEV